MRGISGSDTRNGWLSKGVLRLWLELLKASNLTCSLSLKFGAGSGS